MRLFNALCCMCAGIIRKTLEMGASEEHVNVQALANVMALHPTAVEIFHLNVAVIF